MRAIVIGLALTLATAALVAQQDGKGKGKGKGGPPPVKTYASASDVAAMIANAKSTRKQDQAIAGGTILSLAPYRAALEYRGAIGPAAVHEKEAEMFYVIDGSGTLVTGGKLTDETRTNPENLSGKGIEGGENREVAKGDFFIVPQNTPHWFSKINGTLILMSFHVPRTE